MCKYFAEPDLAIENDQLGSIQPPGERMAQPVKELCGWIFNQYPYKEPLTHLKLQKLFFYCYGALLSEDLEFEIAPELTFEPWEHGPVNRDLYRLLRSKGSSAIVASDCSEVGYYSSEASELLRNAITVYGAMSAWALRNQTHTEEPWKTAYENKESIIDPKGLKRFFKKKFEPGAVAAPEYLFGLNNFKVDGIPVQPYESLHSLAEASFHMVELEYHPL